MVLDSKAAQKGSRRNLCGGYTLGTEFKNGPFYPSHTPWEEGYLPATWPSNARRAELQTATIRVGVLNPESTRIHGETSGSISTVLLLDTSSKWQGRSNGIGAMAQRHEPLFALHTNLSRPCRGWQEGLQKGLDPESNPLCVCKKMYVFCKPKAIHPRALAPQIFNPVL